MNESLDLKKLNVSNSLQTNTGNQTQDSKALIESMKALSTTVKIWK